ncbi:MAG: TOMM precursor leader peptide-binding protein [Dactylosporangium sp.]|nr:TOMM precursor leader peptide-binding protein [Dactylosporangium sp.]NNJ63913.1 TOMM precursor leader peptide-binding protein [Dactylosporangium sp.]
MKLWLPPYLSIRQVVNGIRIGTLPPLAFEVPDPPGFLTDLLTSASTPTYRSDLANLVVGAGWTPEEADALLQDLQDARVLVPVPVLGDRYDRHRLYYQLMGIDADAQQRLAGATVGLMGMGGIGTHLATHLAAAGVGRLVITDGDTVELSNLTRQTLFDESDVGRLKVEAAADHLRRLRSDLTITAIARSFTDPDLARLVAAESGVILLSADRPADVHSWTGHACLAAGIPFSASGYIEGHGSIGPLLHAPATPCFECIRLSAQALPEQDLDERQVGLSTRELNPAWQAPSYGPLNALVAAVQANEAIRWLLGLPASTIARRMLIDSRTYGITWEDFEPAPECPACGRSTPKPDQWAEIAQQYDEERTEHSFNSVLLDDLVPRLVDVGPGMRIADVGAGAGHVATRLAGIGAKVDAFEPSAPMRELLRRRVDHTGVQVQIIDGGLDALADRTGQYEAVCCLNVLDHIEDLSGAVRLLHDALVPGGRLVLSIPHPVKDRGGWQKAPSSNGWDYLHYEIHGYFDEGLCVKAREDRFGNVRVRSVQSHHRTASRYLNEIISAGMTVLRVEEPSPDPRHAETEPVIYQKASKIPYFLVVVAERSRP